MTRANPEGRRVAASAAALADRESDCEALRAGTADGEREIESPRARLTASSARIDAMRNSLSWRSTAALRPVGLAVPVRKMRRQPS